VAAGGRAEELLKYKIISFKANVLVGAHVRATRVDSANSRLGTTSIFRKEGSAFLK